MLFSSMTFLWVFLPLVLLMYYTIHNLKVQNIMLVVMSLLFYAWGEPRNIVLILFSILLNYVFGLLVAKPGKHRKVFVGICVVGNLSLLFLFKYYAFLYNSVTGWLGLPGHVSITLPIGISFFTFQALSYVLDVYRGTMGKDDTQPQRNLINLALYVSLFPQLIAGPIVKYSDIDAQLQQREVNATKFGYGIKRFVVGLGKKVLVSNTMAAAADAIFALPMGQLGTSVAWIGAICYTLQIYFDFSGYSDMAVGLGKMLGFTFMENFNFPYLSRSITEFWRRWHISLSSWFREYLYIPLGGNRKGKGRTYLNLMIVFLATGIWHGANWTFLVWGIYHGFFIIAERLFLGKWLKEHKLVSTVYTLMVVVIGWILFRADSLHLAMSYLKRMFIYTPCAALSTPMYFINNLTIVTAILGILLAGVAQRCWPNFKRWIYDEEKLSWAHVLVLMPLLVVCILYLSSGAYNPFIYFRF